MKKSIAIFLIIMTALVGVLLSPYYTLYWLKSAYDNHDSGTIIRHIDIEKVKTSTKSTLTARLDETMSHNPKLVGLTALFPDVKDKLSIKAKDEINQAVNHAITADNLKKLLNNDISPESKKLVAIWAFASDYVDYEVFLKDIFTHGIEIATKNQEPIVKQKVITRFGKPAPSDVKMQYCGISCFMVTGSISGQPVGAMLHRHGLLDWQIDELILP